MLTHQTQALTPYPEPVHQALVELQTALHRLYGKDAPMLLLYGSYARGDADDASDVDVLLVYPRQVQPGNEIQRLKSTLADLNLRYEVLISVLPASRAQYHHSPSAFWKNIRREGVHFG